MKKTSNTCSTCLHSRDWVTKDLYRCGQPLSSHYKQVLGKHDGCGRHVEMSTLDKAERLYAMSGDREDAA